jgi:hypothetical protein
MKFLIISYNYFPDLNPRAFRWTEICEQFVLFNHSVDVVTFKGSKVIDNETINGVNIKRIGSSLKSRINSDHNLGTYTIQDKRTITNYTKWLRSCATNLLKKIYNITIKKIHWPDSAWLWYFIAVKECKKLHQKNKYDKLITVSHPFTSHLVGLAIKKEYPELFWLADSGDPFCFTDATPTNSFRLYSKLNYKTEKKVFLNADILTFTTTGTSEKYSDLFQEFSSKFRIIPPLVRISKQQNEEINIFNKPNGKIIISYFGVLYKEIRSPEGLLRMINSLDHLDEMLKDKIELHFFGDHSSCLSIFKQYPTLKNQLFFHGIVPKHIVAEAMVQSDLLVNIGNNTSYQLPSKIVEYVAAMKPIINIISISDDSTMAYLKEFSFVNSFNPNQQNDLISLKYLIENHSAIQIHQSKITPFIEAHSPEVIAKDYLKLLS